MASDLVPDEIVLNVLAKLPTKSLLRSRCVSRYWRCMLMEPYFMKLRSHKNIILSVNWENLDLIDGNTYSIIKQLCYPIKDLRRTTHARLIGSFNGLVLMAYVNAFILYNPFTGESKKLPSPPTSIRSMSGFGFGYGATCNDLKIVKLRNYFDVYEVYDFKKNSWSSWSTKKYNLNHIRFGDPMATFVNGYLYWIKSKYVLIVFGLKDMVVSEIVLPSSSNFVLDTLGTINGCLCSLSTTKMTTSSRLFELWVSKEHSIESSWVKTHSFTLDFKWDDYFYHTLNIYDDGKILMVDPFNQLIIYDISKSSYETLEISLSKDFRFIGMNCVQYVETLVSPLDVCSSTLNGRKRKSTR